MKMNKEELKNKIDTYEIPDEIKIEILEDIEDSVEVNDDKIEKSEYENLNAKYEELKTKYKERFMSSDSEVEDEKEDEVDEKEVIDIKEI